LGERRALGQLSIAPSVAQKIRGGQAEQFIPELKWREGGGAGMMNDPKNPFPRGKGNQKGFVGLRPSYPPHPLSLGKGGTERRIHRAIVWGDDNVPPRQVIRVMESGSRKYRTDGRR